MAHKIIFSVLCFVLLFGLLACSSPDVNMPSDNGAATIDAGDVDPEIDDLGDDLEDINMDDDLEDLDEDFTDIEGLLEE